MYFNFNLSGLVNAFSLLSPAPMAIGYAVLQDVCLDHGMPLPPSHFDKNASFNHMYVYEMVNLQVHEVLMSIPTPNHAQLTHLGDLYFRLDIY